VADCDTRDFTDQKREDMLFPISFNFALNMKVLQFSAVIKLVAAPKALQIDEDGEKIR
ncbi:hypothetical protein RYX36_013439, partial [Vicia faba]